MSIDRNPLHSREERPTDPVPANGATPRNALGTLSERDEAAELLRRCCAGQQRGRSAEACDHAPPPPTPSPVIRDPGRLSDTGVLAPGVLRDLETLTGSDVLRGNAVRPLANGIDSFGAMLELVRTATEELRFENFIFRADDVGQTFADELAARAAEGVRVRVLHDPAGALMARTRPADLLFRRTGVDVRLYNLNWPTRRSRALGRDHRKIVVADASKFVAGGICLADPWAGHCIRHCTWRDSAVCVEGPAAATAAHTFDGAWRHGRSLLSRRTDMLEARPPAPPSPAGDVPVRVISEMGPHRRLRRVLERVLGAARTEICITNPYFLPPEGLARVLLDAVGRGVHVEILLPGRNNHPVAGLSSEQLLGPLLRGGVRVFRWRGVMLHAKSLVVDREWTLVGSSNLDSFSLRRNAELNVEIHGSAVGETMARLFRDDCAGSDPYGLTEWRARSRPRRLLGRAASTLRRWQ